MVSNSYEFSNRAQSIGGRREPSGMVRQASALLFALVCRLSHPGIHSANQQHAAIGDQRSRVPGQGICHRLA